MIHNDKQLNSLYWGIVFFAFAALLVSFYMHSLLPVLSGFVFIILLGIFFFPGIAFTLLLLALPLSIEYYAGSLSTDLPSEPLTILLAALTLFYILTKTTSIAAFLRHPFVIIISLLYIWSLTSALFSIDKVVSTKYILAKAWYILGFFVTAYVFTEEIKSLQRNLLMLIVPTVLGVFYIIVRHGLMGFTFDSINAACQPIFRNHVNYAIFIGMLLPYLIYYISIVQKGRFSRLLLTLSTLLFLVAIYFTYTRGVWLALLSLPLFILIVHHKKIITTYVLLLSIILCLGLYLVRENRYLDYAPNYDTTIYHNQLDEHLKATLSGEDMSTMERFYRWIAAIKSVPQYGLSGSGPNTFYEVYKSYTVSSFQTYISRNEEQSTVHNYALLMLTEQGIIGALLYLIWLGVILYFIQKYYHQSIGVQKKLILAISCSIFVFLINNCFSDLVESNKVGSLFYINLAWLILCGEGLFLDGKQRIAIND